jgi:hypothetical protein
MLHIGRILVAVIALSIVPVSCSKSEADAQEAPAAPAMPASWKVKADNTYDHNQREFLETEGRLKGKLKSLRVTTYEVNGQMVQLNTLTPTDSTEGDKIFRILANKKKPWSYVRKGELLYEFVGPEEAEKDIVAAQQMLAR